MSTPEELIARIRMALEAEPRVLGAWLYGSWGRGSADAQSDVDILVVTDDVDGLVTDWPALSDRIGPTVLREQSASFPAIRHITAQWLRYDVWIGSRASIADRGRDTVTLLFDRVGLHDQLRSVAGTRDPDPARVRALTVELLRHLGQLPVVLHRGDPVFGATYAAMTRIIGIELMLTELPDADPGGASRQYAALSAQRRSALEQLPPIAVELASVRAVAIACARLFIPIARLLNGPEFPTELYAALQARWRRELDINLT